DRNRYLFDGVTWLLNQIEDEHGNSLSILNGSGGLPMQVSDGLGRTLSFTYDAVGHVTQVSDGTRTVHYSYTDGTLTGMIDAAGRGWMYAYSGPALLTGVTEPVGNTPVTQAYDPTGRVISQMDAAGNLTGYAYDAAVGHVFPAPMGNPWTSQHDPSGRLMTLIDPAAGPTSYGYDPLGRLSMTSRPMGDATSFAYDETSG